MSLQKSRIARDVPLAVHDAAGAERVAHALVDAVLERDVDVAAEGLQPADARAVDDVIGAVERPAAVQSSASIVAGSLFAAMSFWHSCVDHVQVARG